MRKVPQYMVAHRVRVLLVELDIAFRFVYDGTYRAVRLEYKQRGDGNEGKC